MKKLSLIFLILVIMSSVAFAQNDSSVLYSPNPKAVIFAEVGVANEDELKNRMNQFLEKLQTEPVARGYIINYGTADEISRREKVIRNEISFRTFDAPRIVIVNGGESEIPKTDYWLVPAGAMSPTPDYNKTVKNQIIDPNVRVVKVNETNSHGTHIVERTIKLGMFEAFGNVSDRFFNWIFANFTETLNFDKTLKGYILVYGNDEEISNSMNRIVRLASVQSVGVDRLIVINGGSKKKFAIELWILPEDALPPTN